MNTLNSSLSENPVPNDPKMSSIPQLESPNTSKPFDTNFDDLVSQIKKLTTVGLPLDTMTDALAYVSQKAKAFEGYSDIERANAYWDITLKNELRIPSTQKPNCEFAIVIPVYNEKPERILRQIESLRNQQGINLDEFEIIYVVNNGVLDDSDVSREIRANNQAVIAEIKKITGINAYVVDKSSPGNEIDDCNVGKARNRATAEASLRFYENGKNGLLIHTDADSYFEDPLYFIKLREMLNVQNNTVGIAGGLTFDFSPDEMEQGKYEELKKKTVMLALIKKWGYLLQFVLGSELVINKRYQKLFTGGHMISRSYESAVIGGFFGGNTFESTIFGLELELYGKSKGDVIIGAKTDLILVTAFRESTRTGRSFGKQFELIDVDKPLLVPNPFTAETIQTFTEKIKTILANQEFQPQDLYALAGNKAFSPADYSVVNPIVDALQSYFGAALLDDEFQKAINKLYESYYPKVFLNIENYKKLVEMVSSDLDGRELVKQINIGYSKLDMLN